MINQDSVNLDSNRYKELASVRNINSVAFELASNPAFRPGAHLPSDMMEGDHNSHINFDHNSNVVRDDERDEERKVASALELDDVENDTVVQDIRRDLMGGRNNSCAIEEIKVIDEGSGGSSAHRNFFPPAAIGTLHGEAQRAQLGS